MTKQQIKQICDRHIEALSKSAENKSASEITKIGAYQQQVAIMRLLDELLHFPENTPGQGS